MRKILIGILLGLSLGISISIFAWVNPSQNPPSGGGVLQTSNTGLTINTSTYFISGNVGIGTTNPSTKLEVAGNIRTLGDGTNSIFIANIEGAQKGWFGYADWMGSIGIFEDGGGAYITLKGGNVGIGTTAPSEKLYVAGGNIGLDVVDSGGIKIGTQARIGVDNTNQLSFRGGTGGIRFLNNAQNQVNVFITDTGNVGIGTTTPSQKLHVAGGSAVIGYIAGSSGGVFIAAPAAYGQPAIQGVTSAFTPGTLIINPVGGNVGIGTTTPVQKLHIEGNTYISGNVGIGTTNSGYKLDVNGETGLRGNLVLEGSNKWILHTPDDGRTTLYIAPWGGTDWNWGAQTQFANNGNVYFSGNVGIGTTNPTAKLDVNGDIKASMVSWTGMGMAVWATPGTYSWVVPQGVYKVRAILTGGGGGGGSGGSSWSAVPSGGGGGGGGATAFALFDTTPGETLTIVVGAGGYGGGGVCNASGSNGGSGGSSKILRGSTTLIEAGGGGNGGGGGNSGPAAQGYSGSGGEYIYAAPGVVYFGSAGSPSYGTYGGHSFWGGGTSNNPGPGGGAIGAGGGGGNGCYQCCSYSGRSGMNGIVVIFY